MSGFATIPNFLFYGTLCSFLLPFPAAHAFPVIALLVIILWCREGWRIKNAIDNVHPRIVDHSLQPYSIPNPPIFAAPSPAKTVPTTQHTKPRKIGFRCPDWEAPRREGRNMPSSQAGEVRLDYFLPRKLAPHGCAIVRPSIGLRPAHGLRHKLAPAKAPVRSETSPLVASSLQCPIPSTVATLAPVAPLPRSHQNSPRRLTSFLAEIPLFSTPSTRSFSPPPLSPAINAIRPLTHCPFVPPSFPAPYTPEIVMAEPSDDGEEEGETMEIDVDLVGHGAALTGMEVDEGLYAKAGGDDAMDVDGPEYRAAPATPSTLAFSAQTRPHLGPSHLPELGAPSKTQPPTIPLPFPLPAAAPPPHDQLLPTPQFPGAPPGESAVDRFRAAREAREAAKQAEEGRRREREHAALEEKRQREAATACEDQLVREGKMTAGDLAVARFKASEEARVGAVAARKASEEEEANAAPVRRRRR